MDTAKFREYLKQVKKPVNTINGYARSVEFYAGFLQSQQLVNTPDKARPADLEKFVIWGTSAGENVYRHLWGVRTYYEFIQNEVMRMTSWEWMEYLQNETRKLGEFPNADRVAVRKLSVIGIKTVNQLLRAANSQEKLRALSERSGASLDSVLESVSYTHLTLPTTPYV
jgi:site-specific recombinase XerD